MKIAFNQNARLRKSSFGLRHVASGALYLALPLAVMAAEEPKPVSYYHDVVPIFKRSCTGCHHPGKLKGELDLTSYVPFQKGGKHGPAFKPGSRTPAASWKR